MCCIVTVLAYADNYKREITITFPSSVDSVQSSFRDNQAKLSEILQTIKTIQSDSTLEFVDLIFTGYASPEGSLSLNEALSQKRAQAIERYVNQHIEVPSRVNVQRSTGIAWATLADLVRESDLPEKAQILDIIQNTPEATYTKGQLTGSRRKALMDLQGGRPWNQMLHTLFPLLRTASVTFMADREIIPEPVYVPEPEPEPRLVEVIEEVEIEEEPEPIPEPAPAPLPAPAEKPFYMSLSTNMLYDAFAIPNLGIEFYLGKNISVAGNWQYAWWRHKLRHRYWRTYGGDLACRYWMGSLAHAKPLTGHHLGVYGQILLYDFEWGGTGYLSGYPGKTITYKPTWAVGLEYGFTLPIKRRLNLDFTVGVGYLQGQYMKYKPLDGHDVWLSTHMRRWLGPTKLEVSLVWLIGKINKNAGKGGDE